MLGADGSVACRRDTELEYLGDLRRTLLTAVEDTHVQHSSLDENLGTAVALNIDGGDRQLGDHHHAIGYVKFRIAVGGKPALALLRLHNAGNPTGNSGQIRLVESSWGEKSVTYKSRPKLGKVLAKIGPVTENQSVKPPLLPSWMKQMSPRLLP